MEEQQKPTIKAIIGLGNPGSKFKLTRHNSGFEVLDALCNRYHGTWHEKDQRQQAEIRLGDSPVILIKPQTFMNNSGAVIPFLKKQGIGPENILVIHDELELSFGVVKFKSGGSAKGHNGLRSIIQACGADFARVRFGIGRPSDKNHVPDYVLQRFDEKTDEIEYVIEQAITLIESLF